MTYTAGWNSPGCLPEADPEEFDTPTEAVAYLANMVEMFWDQDSGGCLQSHKTGLADAKWLPVHTALHNAPTAPFAVSTGDGTLNFWVEPAL